MKQQKLSDYQPNYPRKALKGFTLAAAALLAMGTATGCRLVEPQTTGIVPMEEPGVEETCPPDVQTEGIVPVAEPPMTPEPEELVIEGEISVDEGPTEEPEDLMLSGDVAILDLPEGE